MSPQTHDSRHPLSPRRAALGVGVALACCTAACGDPLVTEGYRGDPLFSLFGTVDGELDEQQAALADGLEVGVVWFRSHDVGQMHIEGAALDDVGAALPATFELDLLVPPSARMRGNIQLYGPDNPLVPPERVAAGVLVVAPAGALGALPEVVSSLSTDAGAADEDDALSTLTYVSPYLVVHVRDAEADGLGRAEGVPVPDFQLMDITGFAHGVRLGRCHEETSRTFGYWESEEVQACIAQGMEARAEEIAAADAASAQCDLDCAAAEDYWGCVAGCNIPNVRAEIENTCYLSVTEPWLREHCGEGYEGGPFVPLDPLLPLTLLLGANDIRDVLGDAGWLLASG